MPPGSPGTWRRLWSGTCEAAAAVAFRVAGKLPPGPARSAARRFGRSAFARAARAAGQAHRDSARVQPSGGRRARAPRALRTRQRTVPGRHPGPGPKNR